MPELTVKLGLLLEAAEAHERLAADALERLREHTAGLDAVVREEIRGTLVEELQELFVDGRRAAGELRALGRAARLRLAAFSLAVAAASAAIPLALIWWTLPSRADLAALRLTREQLAANIARLAEHGGRVELRRCGAQQRLCVRVDRSAPAYGASAEFLVVQGY